MFYSGYLLGSVLAVSLFLALIFVYIYAVFVIFLWGSNSVRI